MVGPTLVVDPSLPSIAARIGGLSEESGRALPIGQAFWSLLRWWLRPHRGIAQETRPLYLGFFEFVPNERPGSWQETAGCSDRPIIRTTRQSTMSLFEMVP